MVRIRRSSAILLATLLVGALGACGSGSTSEPVGELLGGQSQGSPGGEWVGDLDTDALITTDAERTAWLDSLSGPIDGADQIAAVDVSRNVLVAVAYPSCTEYSTVYRDTDGARRVLRVEVKARDEKVNCVWSPRRLDVWVVPDDDGSRPEAVVRG